MVYFNFGLWITTAFAAGLVSTVLGNTENRNPTGQGCVDTKGFLSCFESVKDNARTCIRNCETIVKEGTEERTQMNTDCVIGCSGHWLASNIGGWIQSCWNQVCSCDYQLTAIDYFSGTNLVQDRAVPFYPPPDNDSAGACSCNLGYVYGNQTYIGTKNCGNIATFGPNFDDCTCCQLSDAVSNILNVCPKSDLSILSFAKTLQERQEIVGKSADNCMILDQNPGRCASEFETTYYGDKARNPLNLPAGEPGNEPLSNLPGNPFTEPGDRPLTLQLYPGYSSITTLAPFSAGAGIKTGGISVATGGASGSQGGSGTAAAAGQSTGSGTAATKTPSSGTNKVVQMNAIGLGFMYALLPYPSRQHTSADGTSGREP